MFRARRRSRPRSSARFRTERAQGMSDHRIIPIVMPKWGLSMQEGKLTSWLVPDGAKINPGEAILEIETDKIAGAVEATDAGVLRRRVGTADTVYPVKALLGVIADDSVPEEEIERFVSGYVLPPAEEGEAEAGPSYEFAQIGEARLRYAKRGSGAERVILIHGFGGDLDNWLFNIDAIAEWATVYALDLPGHGQSSKTIGDPSVAGLARSVLAFMEAQEIGRAHLVGHSLGGAIALASAEISPDRVASLTLICSAGLGREINQDYIDGFVKASSRRDLKPVLETLFADPSQVSRQLVDDVLKYKRLDGVNEALRRLADGVFPQGSQAQIFSAPSRPTLVIWGRADRIIPSSHASQAGKGRVEIIEGAGHMVQMEQANRVNALIRDHIRGSA
jgi:pyruvate dehydrogenase E2 component (dihydrolipoamide acetyltransferase)